MGDVLIERPIPRRHESEGAVMMKSSVLRILGAALRPQERRKRSGYPRASFGCRRKFPWGASPRSRPRISWRHPTCSADGAASDWIGLFGAGRRVVRGCGTDPSSRCEAADSCRTTRRDTVAHRQPSARRHSIFSRRHGKSFSHGNFAWRQALHPRLAARGAGVKPRSHRPAL